jgi:thymidylate synthase (FAD)
MEKIDVLDHGFVRLVDHMGDDLSVVRAARVSYAAAWRTGEDAGSDHRLIEYLWKHKHTTPFEAVTFTFEIKAPIFVLRQWHRHRTWSYNELSARYRELPEEFYVPAPEHIGVPSKNNKQRRVIDSTSNAAASNLIKDACGRAFEQYRFMLHMGVPREVARTVLPMATYSHMFATVDLLNLLKFLTLRRGADAQFEIQQYADAMMKLAHPIVPVCIGAWLAYGELVPVPE